MLRRVGSKFLGLAGGADLWVWVLSIPMVSLRLAEGVVVGIGMPPRFTLKGDGGPHHDFRCLRREEATLNDKVVVGGLVVTVLDKRHQGDSAHGPGARLPGHIALHWVIHSDHSPNDVPNTLEVALRQAGRARNLIGSRFEHVHDEAIQVNFRIVGDCHGLGD